MSDVTQSELLINALLDGQLDAAEAEHVSEQIAADPKLSEMLAEFTRQRAAFAELPEYKLKDRFADRVLEIAAAEAAARPMLNRPSPSSIDWKKYAMTLAAIAGLLMGMLVYQWTPLSQPDGPTVAVLSSDAKPSSTKDQATRNERIAQELSAESLYEDSALTEISPPLSELDQAPVAVDTLAAAPMADAAKGIGDGAAAADFSTSQAKRSSTAAAELPPPSAISFSGTPMAPPQNQSPPAIDQVWLLEVNERFSQSQLLEALASNSISVPPELNRSAAETASTNEDVSTKDVDGIHVAAKPLQMKNALSQLSQLDAVTISAFHLPSDLAKQEEADEIQVAGEESDAPLSIEPPQQAIAQKLRGNYFAQQPSRPSSMVPETFDKLEMKMGIAPQQQKEAGDEIAYQKTPGDESGVDAQTQPASEIEQLFPSSTLESDRLKNFLILIRDEAPAKK